MDRLTRRSFFARLLGTAAAVVVAPNLPPNYEAMWANAAVPPAVALVDRQAGISIRFIRQYDIETDRWPTRFNGEMFEMQRAYNAQRSAELDDLRFAAGDQW